MHEKEVKKYVYTEKLRTRHICMSSNSHNNNNEAQ